MKIVLVIFLIFFLSGCIGTATTRCLSKNGSVFGSKPYQAVSQDIEFNKENETTLDKFYMLFLFLPVDAIIDTILLPVDLIAIPFGKKKEVGFLDPIG